jgi:hypothetical protein
LNEPTRNPGRSSPDTNDYFHVSVIGFGGEEARSALTGPLAGEELIPISKVRKHPLRIETNEGIGQLVWVDPVASGRTPTHRALRMSKRLIERWIEKYPHSFPPVVMAITDGVHSFEDPKEIAESIRQLSTSDGNVLLFNLHISSASGPDVALFPSTSQGLPNQFAQRLYSMSSTLPGPMRQRAAELDIHTTSRSRGFIFNADPRRVVQFLDVGTSHTRRPLKLS